jgi:uncharacterized protein YuzE
MAINEHGEVCGTKIDSEAEVLAENMYQRHFVYHKSHNS